MNVGGCDRVWDGLMEGWLGGQIGGSMDRWVWYMGVCVRLVGYILEHLFGGFVLLSYVMILVCHSVRLYLPLLCLFPAIAL